MDSRTICWRANIKLRKQKFSFVIANPLWQLLPLSEIGIFKWRTRSFVLEASNIG
jgi:hypothetical protein